jgi:ADP-dependent NAD(P)H-hydrate dehydratase
MSTQPELVTPTLLRKWPLPAAGSSKEDRGSVLIIGGARRTPGAALLAGIAALRAGAGRLTLAVAESAAVQLAVALPEAAVVGLPEKPNGSVQGSAVDALSAELERADAILIGPGLDDAEETGGLLRGLLKRDEAGDLSADVPVVLDAYALGALPGLGEEPGRWAGRLILTPNVKEASILLGRDVDELQHDVAELAEEYQAVVSCQGLIAQPGGKLWEITTGYGGLGTSGSGDVLAGAIVGLRARGTTDAQAACWGTHLHATAGDRLASRMGSVGYLASELAGQLPPLMMELGT